MMATCSPEAMSIEASRRAAGVPARAAGWRALSCLVWSFNYKKPAKLQQTRAACCCLDTFVIARIGGDVAGGAIEFENFRAFRGGGINIQ